MSEIVDFCWRCLADHWSIQGAGCGLPLLHQISPQGISGDTFILVSVEGDLGTFEESRLTVDTEPAVGIKSLISKFALGSA